jgi:hypothetical protein
MRISSLFMKLQRKLRRKKKLPLPRDEPILATRRQQKAISQLKPNTRSETLPLEIPTNLQEIAPQESTSEESATLPNKAPEIASQQTSRSDIQSAAVPTNLLETSSQLKATPQNQSVALVAKPETQYQKVKPPVSKSASVTLEERIRYQKMVLGMTDEQIARALPPGSYTLIGGGIGRPLLGDGHLVYAYAA